MALQLQLNVLAELLRKLHPKYGDWGPELPNVRMFGDLVALNPQPLPPKAIRISAQPPAVHDIADAFIGHMLAQLNTLQYANEGDQKRAGKLMAEQVSDLADWCGTVPLSEKLRELLKKWKWPWPWPPEPDPHPDWASMVAAAATFARAATLVDSPELARALTDGAERVLTAALDQGGFSG